MTRILPQEKLIRFGPENLTIQELIQVIISSGSKGLSYQKITQKIYRTFFKSDSRHDQYDDLSLSYQRVVRIAGIGQVKACRIVAAFELAKRINQEQSGYIMIKSAKDVFKEVRFLINKRQEYIVALYLNGRNQLISKKVLFIGSVLSSLIKARDIITYALLNNAVNIILVHNHPSGEVKPSPEDIKITNRLAKILNLVDLNLIDHVIVGKRGYHSFKES